MASSPSHNSSPVPPIAGVKRRAASLLPAFDPLSSSPGLPRPLKRSRDALADSHQYPTPVPTSSTAILTSSPPRFNARHPLNRSVSTILERAPLSDVRPIELLEDSTPVLMGRSSISCDIQLSANRLISRVHVKAFYKPAVSSLSKDRIEIHCEGWNGVKIHCLGKAHSLQKGEVFTSEERNIDIMVDVHDARVMIRWPAKKGGTESVESASAWGDENSPSKDLSPIRHRTYPMSPLRQRQRIASPVSPSPAVQAALAPSSPLLLPPPSSPPPVEIYEDEEAEEDVIARPDNGATQQSTQVLTQPFGQTDSNSQLPPSSETKEHFLQQSPLIDPPEELSDHDEENDPIVHSFGPFGANLLGSMQAFKTYDSPRSEPPAPRSPITSLKQSTASPTQSTIKADFTQIQSHIINQLAFSRLSSTPLSTIIANLPHGETYKRSDIKDLINETKCIGEIQREGKDAAGKPLESEYYYVADKDDDEMRKGAVVHDLGRTGLRNCRKQHKQYYWRKPKAK